MLCILETSLCSRAEFSVCQPEKNMKTKQDFLKTLFIPSFGNHFWSSSRFYIFDEVFFFFFSICGHLIDEGKCS